MNSANHYATPPTVSIWWPLTQYVSLTITCIRLNYRWDKLRVGHSFYYRKKNLQNATKNWSKQSISPAITDNTASISWRYYSDNAFKHTLTYLVLSINIYVIFSTLSHLVHMKLKHQPYWYVIQHAVLSNLTKKLVHFSTELSDTNLKRTKQYTQ